MHPFLEPAWNATRDDIVIDNEECVCLQTRKFGFEFKELSLDFMEFEP